MNFIRQGFRSASSFRNAPMSDDELRRAAPSIFALEPWQKMSDRYRFVPTIDVVTKMRQEGFMPVRAEQGRTRIPGKGSFTKHMIRFRQADVMARQVGQEIPELVLVNSHDGSSAYVLFAGIFRIACMNGLIVASSSFGEVRTRHSGKEDLAAGVIDASFEVVEEFPKVASQIETWKGIMLAPPQQEALARAATEVRSTALAIEPRKLLWARRSEDQVAMGGARSLWATANVVQENLMKGGAHGVGATGRRSRLRGINSVTEDVRVNRAIWRLTEEMAKLAA